MLKINLLPKEVLIQRNQSAKVILLNKISIGILVILVVLTVSTLGIRFLQSSDIKKADQDLALAQSLVSNQSDKASQELLLKSQLQAIMSYSGLDSSRKAIFNLVVALTPSDVSISDATVDRNSNMAMSLSSKSLESISNLFSDLSDPEKNAGLISKIDMDGLSVGRDGTYHFGLRITAK